jgi:hypothetical protein
VLNVGLVVRTELGAPPIGLELPESSSAVGLRLGGADGTWLGSGLIGLLLGWVVAVVASVGGAVGLALRPGEGLELGPAVGSSLGLIVGPPLKPGRGATVGSGVGLPVGLSVGTGLGT